MILEITLIGFVAGIVGTVSGAIISLVFRKSIDKYLDIFMGLCGGIMLSVVSFELITESIQQMGTLNSVIFCIVGVLSTYLIKNSLEFEDNLRGGYLIFISMLIHNFPEGLAIGSSYLWKQSLGITLALIIGLHNIPEGLAMALSLIKGKMNVLKVFGLTFLAGVPMGIGSFVGAYFGNIFSDIIGIFLAIAAGTMLYITIDEIFPRSKPEYCVLGFLLGIFIVNLNG
ncbi:zinc transporter, ZIP family [Alkalithermobacter thermoalcaliphilus JW-YL-7 = DSM 7308]|uniref:Zinc transporter, ZIP family n=1 Tax=Alkalithermobacter thermoalcaliphilus JW-YL-7 = DSM 7308 TaxID=1121328 RepID=A0A150FSI1_CLOPD|nr:zinc/iron permease [[Clostridium] paradoxum JW-YL-7 = DSM 7308]SHK71417.1 zinc transporter, ZIP family [[Clostridium] paradoxum JW-YL-7 = DSM 7308]